MFKIKKVFSLFFLSSAFCALGLLPMVLTSNKAIAHDYDSINQNGAIEKQNKNLKTKFNGLLKITYKESLNPTYKKVFEYMKSQKRYEILAAAINKRIELPRDIKVIVEDCGIPNAYYDPQERTITMCHELAFQTFNNLRKIGVSEKKALIHTANVMSFSFFHESGHMVIHELDLPITGKEEDVADQFAVFMLSKLGKFGHSIIASTATELHFWSKQEGEKITNAQLMGTHSLSKQRFFNLLCSLYIQDPDTYASGVTKLGYSPSRLRMCRNDSEKIFRSFTVMLEPYRK